MVLNQYPYTNNLHTHEAMTTILLLPLHRGMQLEMPMVRLEIMGRDPEDIGIGTILVRTTGEYNPEVEVEAVLAILPAMQQEQLRRRL